MCVLSALRNDEEHHMAAFIQIKMPPVLFTFAFACSVQMSQKN
jgi:hypothetical protein